MDAGSDRARGQGTASFRFHHRSFGLYFLAANLSAEVTVLDSCADPGPADFGFFCECDACRAMDDVTCHYDDFVREPPYELQAVARRVQ